MDMYHIWDNICKDMINISHNIYRGMNSTLGNKHSCNNYILDKVLYDSIKCSSYKNIRDNSMTLVSDINLFFLFFLILYYILIIK